MRVVSGTILAFLIIVTGVSAGSIWAHGIAPTNIRNTAPLLEAAYNDEIEKVRQLLQSGADPNVLDEYQRTPLMLCTYDSDKCEVVKLLLASRADVNAKDYRGNGVLFYALHRPAVLQLLLSKNPDLAARSDDDRTPLEEAAHKGYEPSVQLLLRARAPGNLKAERLWSEFFHAVSKGDEQRVKRMLRDAPGLVKVHDYHRRALNLAAELGHLSIVTELLNRRAEVNVQDGNGWTPALEAAANGRTDTLRLLVERGADLRAKDNDGRTLLMEASLHEHRDTVEFLLTQRIEVNAADKWGRTALQGARYRQRPDIALMLLKAGARESASP